MFTIETLHQPQTLSEVKQLVEKFPDITILGGCGFLKLSSRKIPVALDLSRCELDRIRETEQQIEIGAMVTLRDIEKNPALNQWFDGALPKAVSHILGVQFRSCATIGASVYSKYGFSDIVRCCIIHMFPRSLQSYPRKRQVFHTFFHLSLKRIKLR